MPGGTGLHRGGLLQWKSGNVSGLYHTLHRQSIFNISNPLAHYVILYDMSVFCLVDGSNENRQLLPM